MALTGKTNEEKVWNYLYSKIKNKYGVAGLMGNLEAESGFNPIDLEDTYEKKLGYTDQSYTDGVNSGKYANFIHDKAGYGLAQWTFWSRKKALYEYALLTKKVSIGDLEMQLEFLVTELQEELRSTEDKIAYARQFYNDSVTMYNTKLETIPTNIIASMFNFKAEELFQAASDEARQNVKVSF